MFLLLRVRTWPVVLVGAVLLSLAACGGDSESESERYANDVCGSLNTWATDIEATVQDVTDAGLAISAAEVQTAVNEVKSSTQTLKSDLGGLGAPETEDGSKAKSELDRLLSTLSQQVDKVEQAAGSGSGTAALVGTVTSAVAAAADAADTVYQNLRGLDPGGELSDAFKNSDDCKQLKDQLDRNSS